MTPEFEADNHTSFSSESVQTPLPVAIEITDPILSKSPPHSNASIEVWLEETKAAHAVSPGANPLKRKRGTSNTLSRVTIINESARKNPESCQEAVQGTEINKMPDDAREFQEAPTPSTTATDSNPPATPKTDKSSGIFETGKDAGFIGRRMTQHGLHQNSKNLQKYPSFEKAVRDIIGAERHSVMGQPSAENILAQREYYADRNEDTVLQNLIPLIIKSKYLAEVKAQNPVSLTEALRPTSPLEGGDTASQDNKRYVATFWFADSVDVAVNEEFRRTFLPTRYDDVGFGAELAKALKKVDGMTNPKPDYCYGIRNDKFPVPNDIVIDQDLDAIIEVMPGTKNIYFIIEGKSNKGNHTDAENRARRGGATLVYANGLLRERIGIPEVTGADDRTFVFSATMTPEFIAIWVHWAEVTDKGTIFHMNRLTQKLLSEAGHLGELRVILHNILEWGCIGRVEKLEDLHTKLHTWQRVETKKRKELEQTKKEGEKSNKRPRRG